MAQRLTRLMPTVRATSGNQTHRNRQLYVLARHSFAGCFCGPSPVLLRSPKPAELGIRMRAASSTDGPKNDTTISKSSKPQVIVLTGATGVGKTELSLILAESLNGEIISADSVQVSEPTRVIRGISFPASRSAVPAWCNIRWFSARRGLKTGQSCIGTIHVTAASSVNVTPVAPNFSCMLLRFLERLKAPQDVVAHTDPPPAQPNTQHAHPARFCSPYPLSSLCTYMVSDSISTHPQVYKHMDVGSDKLPLSKRRGEPPPCHILFQNPGYLTDPSSLRNRVPQTEPHPCLTHVPTGSL